jgi:hypothetical protein
LPPKHQVKPRPCIDQKARKTTTMTWFTKSAKPPSPVQIRAAPPTFLRKLHRLFLRRTTMCSQMLSNRDGEAVN